MEEYFNPNECACLFKKKTKIKQQTMKFVSNPRKKKRERERKREKEKEKEKEKKRERKFFSSQNEPKKNREIC
jgi:hypothetical protein